jgi:predicted enzyme related to lactoylglutathione lyase
MAVPKGESRMTNTSSTGPWLASVPIVVSDKSASKKWYTENLGLALIADDGHWVTVGNPSRGSALHLCQGSENHPQPIPLEPGPWGYVVAIPGDFRTECRRMKEHGVEFTHDPEEAPWGWYAIITDPDRNLLYLSPAPK